ncbi:LLM class flavin-dependent oxidoreductase [Leucobacter soli]|uniref:Monooxygenase MoxC n=1 Tax=Leucobacter soli TaxID=2812850 RepID=A0A916NWF4_9MICO|nr:LLM class flavin-dependent oxidoreductase [Leucobacter soli]CAG7616488.1 Putative monooxygenase MoxC [Leucobacter soli]
MSRDHIRFGLLLEPTGNAVNGWIDPATPRGAAVDFGLISKIVDIVEAAKFSFVFVADSVSVEPGAKPYYLNRFEPISLLGALAVQTKDIGLVATMSASYTDPYTVARQIASIDLLSGGRAGINVVTSAWESSAANFSDAPLLPHDERYARADEYVRVMQGLWDSYEDDAFVEDPATRVYLDESKQHRLDFTGDYFSVRGPLNIQRSPQGHPVIFQAGSSPTGRAFASTHAEAIFAKNNTFEGAAEYYGDVKRLVGEAGRDPDLTKIFMGAHVVVAPTRAEAEDKFERILSYTDDAEALKWLSFFYDYADLSGYDLDGPFPDLSHLGANHMQGISKSWSDLAKRDNLTLRQVARIAATPREDFFGTPEEVADALEHWYRDGAADGFLLNPWLQTSGLEDFVSLVLPELRRRGLYPDEYAGGTLRENLGLPYVPNRHTVARGAR